MTALPLSQNVKRYSRDDGWGRSTRFYDIPGGRSLPSVTSILQIVAKPALINWAARVEREMCIEAAANLYTDTLGGKEFIRLSRPTYITSLEARIGKQKASSKLLAKATDIGTAVHALIEWNLRKEFGQKVGPAPKLPDGAHQAFAAYQTWRQGVKLTPLAIEQTVWSETYGYAGTMDLYAELDIDGKPARGILDWKTGKGIYGEALLQNVAYIQALVEMGHAQSPVHGLIVRFPKTAAESSFEVRVIHPESQARYFDAFLAAQRLWTWNETEAMKEKGDVNGTGKPAGKNGFLSSPSSPSDSPNNPNSLSSDAPAVASDGISSSGSVSSQTTQSALHSITSHESHSTHVVNAKGAETGTIAKLTVPAKRPAKKGPPQNATIAPGSTIGVTDAPDIVRDYNSALGARLGLTAGNLAAVMRAKGQGYTREQFVRVFAAVRDKATETAAWCAENNHGFEYLIRPTYRHYRSGEPTPGPLDKILNELDGATPTRKGEPSRPVQTDDEAAKQRSLWEAGRELFKRETGL